MNKFICDRCNWRGFNNGQCLECDGVSEDIEVDGVEGTLNVTFEGEKCGIKIGEGYDGNMKHHTILCSSMKPCPKHTSNCSCCSRVGCDGCCDDREYTPDTRLISRFINWLKG